MDTKIPDGPSLDLHPMSKRPHAVFGVNSTVTAQASDDKVHYLQRLLLVSAIRAIKMCASIALRSLLRLSPRGVRGVAHGGGYSIGPDNYDRLRLAVQVVSIVPLARRRRHFARLFRVNSNFSVSRLLRGGKQGRINRGDPIYPTLFVRSVSRVSLSRVHHWRKLTQVTWFHARDDRASIIDVPSTELRLIRS